DTGYNEDQSADDCLNDIAAHPVPPVLPSVRQSTWAPCLIRRLRLVGTVDQGRARRPVGEIGAAEIAQMILLPRLARQAARGRRRVGRVMEPAVPVGRYARGFGFALIDHPALAPTARDDA